MFGLGWRPLPGPSGNRHMREVTHHQRVHISSACHSKCHACGAQPRSLNPPPFFAVCRAALCCVHAHVLCRVLCPCCAVPRVLQATLPTSDVKSSTETKASKSGSKITWGDFGRQQPWAVEELKVHFHHDKPFKRVRR